MQVRGANYLNDKKKVEAEGLEAELLNVDLVELEEKFWNIAEVLPAVTNSTAPFMFIMQARSLCSRGRAAVCRWYARVEHGSRMLRSAARALPQGTIDVCT